MMLRKLLGGLLAAAPLALLAGCCGNVACNCQDLLADALYFSFDPGQFSRHELNVVYLARYDASTRKPSLDSLPLPQRARKVAQYQENYMGQDTTGLLILNNNAPFAVRAATTNLSSYYYYLYVPLDSIPGVFYKKPRYTTFQLTGIKLTGSYQGDGCCTCYRNSQKRVVVSGGSYNGQPFNVTQDGGPLLPRVVPLRKR